MQQAALQRGHHGFGTIAHIQPFKDRGDAALHRNFGKFKLRGGDESASPVVTCDPRQGLKAHQYFNPSCFAAPSIGNNGTFRLPYIHGPAYFNDEIGIFKDFNVREGQKLELRFQGFDFLNRSFDTYQQYDSALYMDFTGLNAPPTNAASVGTTTTRTGHRAVQLEAKYFF